ncbi:MAG: DUF4340 domain-containing protein [bacterium]
MKQFKSTVVIFVIFIGFISYYFLIEKKKTNKEEEQKIYIFNLIKDDFETLELTDMSDKSTFLLKKEKDWKIITPCEMPASKKTIDGIISELAVLSAQRDITKKNQRLKQYGLDVPRYRIKFSLKNESHTLLIGIKSPTEEFYFVKEENKDNVYMVNAVAVEKFIKKHLADLRDKEFLQVPEEKIKKININLEFGKIKPPILKYLAKP